MSYEGAVGTRGVKSRRNGRWADEARRDNLLLTSSATPGE